MPTSISCAIETGWTLDLGTVDDILCTLQLWDNTCAVTVKKLAGTPLHDWAAQTVKKYGEVTDSSEEFHFCMQVAHMLKAVDNLHKNVDDKTAHQGDLCNFISELFAAHRLVTESDLRKGSSETGGKVHVHLVSSAKDPLWT